MSTFYVMSTSRRLGVRERQGRAWEWFTLSCTQPARTRLKEAARSWSTEGPYV